MKKIIKTLLKKDIYQLPELQNGLERIFLYKKGKDYFLKRENKSFNITDSILNKENLHNIFSKYLGEIDKTLPRINISKEKSLEGDHSMQLSLDNDKFIISVYYDSMYYKLKEIPFEKPCILNMKYMVQQVFYFLEI